MPIITQPTVGQSGFAPSPIQQKPPVDPEQLSQLNDLLSKLQNQQGTAPSGGCGCGGNNPTQYLPTDADPIQRLKALKEASWVGTHNTVVGKVTEASAEIAAPINFSKLDPAAAATLKELDSQIKRQVAFLSDRVIPTIFDDAKKTGSINQSALLKVSSDARQLTALHSLVRRLAEAGPATTARDAQLAGELYESAQRNGSINQRSLIELMSTLAVREGKSTPAAGQFAKDIGGTIGDKLDFLNTRVIPTIYGNAQQTGSIDQNALLQVSRDQSKMLAASAALRDIVNNGKNLTDADFATAKAGINYDTNNYDSLIALAAKV